MINKSIGHYQIKEKIGKEEMGVVYKGTHIHLPYTYIIKIFPEKFSSYSILIKRFQEEAKIMAGLKHPDIVKVIDMGNDEGTYYLVMEYIEGESLEQLLKRQKKLPLNQALNIITQVCSALEYAHEKGIIHRNIKPSNILLTKEEKVKITDFGIGKITGEEIIGEKTQCSI